MPRVRSPNRDKAFEIYKEHKGKIDLIDIAKELNISSGTVRGWKNKDCWDDKLNGTLQKNTERSKREKSNIANKKKSLKKEVEELLENDELTDKQRLFCAYYIKCFNATKAYKKAYKCSYDTAMVEGCKSLRNPKIKATIDKLREYKLNKIFLTEEDIFQRYLEIAYADITDYLEFGNCEINIGSDEEPKYIKSNYINLKDSKDLDGSIISEVKQGKNGISLKLHDALKALEWLSEHMNIATDKQKAEIELIKANVNLVKVKAEEVEGRLF